MRKFGPKTAADALRTSELCPACKRSFVAGDYTTLISLGPGNDEEEQKKCREGRAYNAVAVEVHWNCAGGIE